MSEQTIRLMELWDKLETTDTNFTKTVSQGSYTYTSINPEYQFKKMTKLFGPVGAGWGYELLATEFHKGADMVSKTTDGDGVPINYGPCRVHTARIRLWYCVPPSRDKFTVDGTGHTPFVYLGRYGPVTDTEYEKKSITDAITKAMAFLGMSADVRMGMFDKQDYVEGLQRDEAIEASVDKAAEMTKQRQEFEDWLNLVMEQMATSESLHELEVLYTSGIIRVKKQGDQGQIAAFENLKNKRATEIMKANKEVAA